MIILCLLTSFLKKVRTKVRIELTAAAMIAGVAICPFQLAADDVEIPYNGTVAIWARSDLIREDPITLKHNGVLVDDPNTPGTDLFDVIEIYDQVPGTSSFPLTWADLIGNCFFRTTYQKSDGKTGNLGTSVVACPSYRTSGGVLQFIPTVTSADIETGPPASERILNTLTASFGSDANVTSIRTYPDPVVGVTKAGVSVELNVFQSIALDSGQLGNDAFRFVTVSSMFSTNTVYDANVLRWETPDSQVKKFRLANSTPRDAHLLAAGTQLGCWFELVKEPGSTWFHDSPTIRVEISDCEDVSQQLGIQGFLAATQNPNDDSLSVWIEWLDAPNPIPANTSLSLSFMVTATAPRLLPRSALAPQLLILLEQP